MFKGRYSETRVIERCVNCNPVPALFVSKFREPSPVESFNLVEFKPAFSGKCKRVINDIYMLFNQQRLDKMTLANLLTWLQNSSVTSDGMRSLRSKLSDSQLISFVKSRYIQSPGELLSWSKYLEQNVPEVSPELQAAVDELKNPKPSSAPAPDGNSES